MAKLPRPKLPPWPYPAPGKFAEWKFIPYGTAGGWWMLSAADNPHRQTVSLQGSIRKHIYTMTVYDTERHCVECRSLRRAEAAYTAYLLTGSLPS